MYKILKQFHKKGSIVFSKRHFVLLGQLKMAIIPGSGLEIQMITNMLTIPLMICHLCTAMEDFPCLRKQLFVFQASVQNISEITFFLA